MQPQRHRAHREIQTVAGTPGAGGMAGCGARPERGSGLPTCMVAGKSFAGAQRAALSAGIRNPGYLSSGPMQYPPASCHGMAISGHAVLLAPDTSCALVPLRCIMYVMSDRPAISPELKSQVLVEAAHRCAVCHINITEIAHIIPWRTVKEHKLGNLIALCPNCHALFDKGHIPAKDMDRYKSLLAREHPELYALKETVEQQEQRILEQSASISIQAHTIGRITERCDELERQVAELKQQRSIETEPGPLIKIQERIDRLVRALRLFDEGSAAYKRSDYKKALKCLERSRELESTPAVNNNLGLVYVILERFNDALAAFNESIRLREELGLLPEPSVALNRGEVFFRLRRFNEALSACDRAEQLYVEQQLPVDPYVSMNRGVVYGELGRLEDAQLAFDESERLRKEQKLQSNPDLAMNRGNILALLWKLDAALAAYDEAELLYKQLGLPPDPALSLNQAQLRFDQGNKVEACRIAREAKRLYEKQGRHIPLDVVLFLAKNCSEESVQ
jgi:tetratricopeptide (TPR) repeat protein